MSRNLGAVMFWIRGSAYNSGEVSDGIFVEGIWRITVMLLLSRSTTALEDGTTNGNYGISDQITALRWVREHIADFGGDLACYDLWTVNWRGLFSGAIAQSNLDRFGYVSTYSNYYTIGQEYNVVVEPMVEYVGCTNATDVLTCLRDISAGTLVNAPTAPRYVVVDGTLVTTNQLALNGTRPTAPAHVVFGSMRDDGFDFQGTWPTANTTEARAMVNIGIV